MKTTDTGKICVAIPGSSVEETLSAAASAEAVADVIEIRLDGIDKPQITPFTNSLTKPLLFTNRASWEGGFFKGTEEERLHLLEQAIKQRAAYIDIELKTEDDLKLPLIKKAKENKTTTIVSWHNFSVTPSPQALNSILQEQYRSGADIGKIVTMAKTYQDVLQVLNLQLLAAEMDFPLIAFCMGAPGVISRVATVHLGGYMTYAAADGIAQTAPGQLPASKLKNALKEIRGED